jgi:hypothetical protein
MRIFGRDFEREIPMECLGQPATDRSVFAVRFLPAAQCIGSFGAAGTGAQSAASTGLRQDHERQGVRHVHRGEQDRGTTGAFSRSCLSICRRRRGGNVQHAISRLQALSFYSSALFAQPRFTDLIGT